MYFIDIYRDAEGTWLDVQKNPSKNSIYFGIPVSREPDQKSYVNIATLRSRYMIGPHQTFRTVPLPGIKWNIPLRKGNVEATPNSVILLSAFRKVDVFGFYI